MASPSTILTALLAATTTTSPLPAQTFGPQTVNLVSRLCADQSTSCSDTTYLAWLNTPFSLNITTSQLSLSSAQNVDIDLVNCEVFFTGGDAGPLLTADTPVTLSSGLVDIGNVTCSVSDEGKGQDQAGQIRPGDNATTTWVHGGDAIPVTTTTATGAVPTITGWGGAVVDGGNETTATGSTPPSTTTYTGGASGLEVARLLAAIAAVVGGWVSLL
ncbi:hypothetical protein B0A48_13760 [Cryoendolithus antarcticus]|uniref:Ig-like domain-containing protein n=1 Tax=Cryoendolithus antarcticus TaxID=1507870 RepID=A0A1V8SN72_9PEZI|nr:hypothetical protein B0A48_13760 [Cryoendolithus antarcticus]